MEKDRRKSFLTGMLFVYTFLFWCSKELAKPAISIALSDSAESESLIGVLLSLQNFLPLILSIPFSTLGDKFGQEKILHLGSAMTAASGVCFLLSGITGLSTAASIALLTVGQIISGIAWTVAWISLQAMVSDCDSTGQGINRIILIMSIGLMTGPIISGLLTEHISLYSVWIVNALLCVMQFILSQLMLTEYRRVCPKIPTAEKEKAQFSLKQLMTELGGTIFIAMVLLSFVMMFTSEIRSSFLTVLLRTSGVSADLIGTIVSAGAVATFVIRLIMNLPVFEKTPPKAIIAVSMLLALAGLASMGIIPQGTAFFLPSILLGLSAGMVEPVIIMIILQNSYPERKGLALAGRTLVNRLGMFVAPLAACGLNDMLGITAAAIILTVGTGGVVTASFLLNKHGENRRNRNDN